MAVNLPMAMVRGHINAGVRDTNKNKSLDVGDVVVKNKVEFVVSDYDVINFDNLDSFLERASNTRIDIFPNAKDPAKADLLVVRPSEYDVAVVEPDGLDLASYPWFRAPDRYSLDWQYQSKSRRCGNNRQCQYRVQDLYRRVLSSARRYENENRDLQWEEHDFRRQLSVTANQVSTYLYAVERYRFAESDYQSDLMWFEMG